MGRISWNWGAWWKHRVKTGSFPDEMGVPLIILFKTVCRSYPAEYFSAEDSWFDDEGYPLDSAQEVMLATISALVRSEHNFVKWNDRQLHFYIRVIIKNEIRKKKKKGVKLVYESELARNGEDEMPLEKVARPLESQLDLKMEVWKIASRLNKKTRLALWHHFCYGFTLERASKDMRRHLRSKVSKSSVKNWHDAGLRKFSKIEFKDTRVFRKFLTEALEDLLVRSDLQFIKRGEFGVYTVPIKVKMPPGFMKKLNAIK